MPWQPHIFKTSHSTSQKHVPRGGPSGQQGLTIDAIAVALAFFRESEVPHGVSVTAWPEKNFTFTLATPKIARARLSDSQCLPQRHCKKHVQAFDASAMPQHTKTLPYEVPLTVLLLNLSTTYPAASMSNNMTNSIVQIGQVDCRSAYHLTQP
jgi:hypothetical protein